MNPASLRRRAAPCGVAAFTFVEILAALLFLAMVVPAIVGALSVATRASEKAARSAMAGELAKNKMSEFLTGNSWQNPNITTGDFAGAYPGYRWEMTSENWTGDSVNTEMTALHVVVHYTVQGNDRTFRLSTLVYAPGTTAAGIGTTGATGAMGNTGTTATGAAITP